MPEWPDLEVFRERLAAHLLGARCAGAEVVRPTVLRFPVAGTLDAALRGRQLASVRHRGKFLVFGWSARAEDGGDAKVDEETGLPYPCLVVNPMLTGMFQLAGPQDRLPRDTCLVFTFDRPEGPPESVSLRYLDERQMGKVYWVPESRYRSLVAGWQAQGPEADLATLDEEAWVQRARRHQHEVRNLLMHQPFVAGIGNAYADEILWRAGLHPKRAVRSLGDEELRRLYRTTRDLMQEALEEIRRHLPPELNQKVRHFFGVRGHAGEPCPRCGTRIVRRSLGYLETDFCPRCQLAPPGQIY